MYRARVQAVSGNRVFAGGKWLTCIGNKNVKAGDFIWTDGRCVYGNFQEAQTPIVITPKEDWIIPVKLDDMLFNFRNGKLKRVGELTQGIILNDKMGHVYSSSVVAANMYNPDNLYVIDGSNADYNYMAVISTSPNGNAVDCNNQNPRLIIKKNKEVIKEIPLANLVDMTATVAKNNSSEWQDLPQPFTFSEPNGYGSTHGDALFVRNEEQRKGFLQYAFIENENSWEVIYFVETRYTYNIEHWTWGEGYYPGEFMFYYGNLGTSNVLRFYYINSKGTNEIIYQVELVNNYDDYYRSQYPITFRETVTPNTDNINIAMQDGYYFRIEYLYEPAAIWLPGIFVKYTIYSPNGKSLCVIGNDKEFNAYNNTRLSIYKISGKDYLIGTLGAEPKSNFNGLFHCSNDGKLTQIAEGHFFNYYLRPMKSSKCWWIDIQNLE